MRSLYKLKLFNDTSTGVLVGRRLSGYGVVSVILFIADYKNVPPARNHSRLEIRIGKKGGVKYVLVGNTGTLDQAALTLVLGFAKPRVCSRFVFVVLCVHLLCPSYLDVPGAFLPRLKQIHPGFSVCSHWVKGCPHPGIHAAERLCTKKNEFHFEGLRDFVMTFDTGNTRHNPEYFVSVMYHMVPILFLGLLL